MPNIPAGAKKPSDRRRAEESTDHYVGELAGVEIRVLPPGEWRKSANVALRQANWDAWAASAVHADDVEAFQALDPTNDEFSVFIQGALRNFGINQGESKASTPS